MSKRRSGDHFGQEFKKRHCSELEAAGQADQAAQTEYTHLQRDSDAQIGERRVSFKLPPAGETSAPTPCCPLTCPCHPFTPQVLKLGKQPGWSGGSPGPNRYAQEVQAEAAQGAAHLTKVRSGRSGRPPGGGLECSEGCRTKRSWVRISRSKIPFRWWTWSSFW